MLSSQLSQENNLPFNIILNKKRISIDCIKQKDIYIEVQSLEKFNDIYKQKWESVLNNTSLNWSDVWTNIHQTKIGLDIKSAFSQNCDTIRTKELICMWVCVFSNYNTVLLQFYAQFYCNSTQIYHCKNHLISLYFYHSIKFQLENLCKG